MLIVHEGFVSQITNPKEQHAPLQNQVKACQEWLWKYAKKKRKAEGERLNSYYLKRVVENSIGNYVSNGALIQAALDLGYQYEKTDDGPNAYFHIELLLPEEEWKRVRPTGFTSWLFKQKYLRLADDAKVDPNWPRQAKRFIDFWRYLKCDGDGWVSDELCDAWETWSGKMSPRPDWINTDIVYSRQCDFIKYGDPYPVADKGTTYLYALTEVDPVYNLVRVRYVGQAVSPSKRLNDHIKRPGSIDRVKWIGRMLNQDTYPEMAIFYSGAARSMANGLEKAAIYAFQECETRWDDQLDGFPPLDDALLNIDK